MKPNRQIFYIFDEKGNKEYKIVFLEKENHDEYRLYTTNSEIWCEHARNKLQLKLIDDGNGMKFDRPLQTLQYHEAEYLRILLSINNSMQKRPVEPFLVLNEVEMGPHYKVF
jgi:hypothetical protein